MNPKEKVDPKEKVKQLKSKDPEYLIGNIPESHSKTVDACIEYLGGKIINDTNDPLWSVHGGNIVIRGARYDYDDLVIVERAINATSIYRLVGETYYYSDADSFVCDCAQGLDFMDPESTEVDMTLVEQLRILWHVMQDPFENLLERMALSQWDCSMRFCIPLNLVNQWLHGETSVPPYIRLMMAEALGVLTIRNLA